MTLYSYQIAAGWDNSAGFTNVESIAVTGASVALSDIWKRLAATAYYVVSAEPTQHDNRVRVSDGTTVQNGYPRQDWRVVAMSGDALKHWRDNYVGKVTVATKSDDIFDTYTNKNAIADYPVASTDSRRYYKGQWWYFDVLIPLWLLPGTAS